MVFPYGRIILFHSRSCCFFLLISANAAMVEMTYYNSILNINGSCSAVFNGCCTVAGAGNVHHTAGVGVIMRRSFQVINNLRAANSALNALCAHVAYSKRNECGCHQNFFYVHFLFGLSALAYL